MADIIYTEKELIKRCGVSPQEFNEYRKYNIISPIVNNESGTELYARHSLDVLKKIRQLKSIGYELEEIRKIVKKIGLPDIGDKAKSDDDRTYYTVGELAEKIGVNARTIKHWEDKGIIFPDARSAGGFRLYQDIYVFFGKLILDLQMFGYTLDEIKTISDMFRDFVTISSKPDTYPIDQRREKLNTMQQKIEKLFTKMNSLKEGISRWEDLLLKKQKEINKLIDKSNKE